MDTKTQLKKRLDNIWKDPEFPKFFREVVKKPAKIIKKGTLLFDEFDKLNCVYCILEGFVKLYRLSDEGRETTTYLYGPGSISGIRALTSEDERAKHFAEAITDLKVVTISRREYLDVLYKHPEYIVDLAHIFMQRLNYTERKLEGFIVTDAVARVAIFLNDVVKRFCKDAKGPVIELPLELTHQRISEFVGSFRETVTLALHKLEKKGILKIKRSQITILDPKRLEQLSTINKP